MSTATSQHEIQLALARILAEDAQSPTPVVRTISLEFWGQLKRWVRHISQSPQPFTIALSGGSGSGKSHVRKILVSALQSVAQVSAFSQDNYYRDFSQDFADWSLERFYDQIDFDDPAHIRFDDLIQDLTHLKTLRSGQTFYIPKLVYGTPEALPTRIPNGLAIPVCPFIVTEGIHAFHQPGLRALYDFRIYVDVDETTRRERWLARNLRDNRGVTDNMWQTTVNCLESHILPNRAYADLVLNNAAPAEQITAFMQRVIAVLQSAAVQAA